MLKAKKCKSQHINIFYVSSSFSRAALPILTLSDALHMLWSEVSPIEITISDFTSVCPCVRRYVTLQFFIRLIGPEALQMSYWARQIQARHDLFCNYIHQSYGGRGEAKLCILSSKAQTYLRVLLPMYSILKQFSRVPSHLQSQYQAVVFVSTPRMYLRRGYFLAKTKTTILKTYQMNPKIMFIKYWEVSTCFVGTYLLC